MKPSTNRDLLLNISGQLYYLNDKIDIIDKRTETYPKLYENVDKLIGEIVENRQERTSMNKEIQNHESRLKSLESEI
uniref:Uncharacterized protein n=1 Tax=candidate division WWE3 bacterium TaxID=2053526 RepID=A0A7C4XTC5_UNCKA